MCHLQPRLFQQTDWVWRTVGRTLMEKKYAGILQRGTFSFCLLLFVSIVSLLPFSVHAATSINDYAVYGENGVFIGVGSTVVGLVGGRSKDTVNGNAIKLNGTAAINGNARSGANVNLQNNCSITGTLFIAPGGVLTTNSGDFIGAVVVGDPMLPTFPSASVFSAGSSNVTTATNPLTPGSYGSVSYGNGGDLKMSAGTYFMASLTLSGNTQVHLDATGGPINVYITGNVTMNNRQAIVAGSNGLFWEVHGDWSQGGGSSWAGTLFVPTGTAHIGAGSG